LSVAVSRVREQAVDVVKKKLWELLGGYQPRGDPEAADLARVRDLVETAGDPWLRTLPLHLTGSALIVSPDRAEVLLRWHRRHQAWLQVGGHGDPGEHDPLAIALREAREETGLHDLAPWPDGALRHLAIVDVPAARGEPAHEHADLRFTLATNQPGAARPEAPDAPLRWVPLDTAVAATAEPNLKETISRVHRLVAGRRQP
jgi:8-oxo-dGTP pyrophosphatase MutT (NUDIX family)